MSEISPAAVHGYTAAAVRKRKVSSDSCDVGRGIYLELYTSTTVEFVNCISGASQN